MFVKSRRCNDSPSLNLELFFLGDTDISSGPWLERSESKKTIFDKPDTPVEPFETLLETNWAFTRRSGNATTDPDVTTVCAIDCRVIATRTSSFHTGMW